MEKEINALGGQEEAKDPPSSIRENPAHEEVKTAYGADREALSTTFRHWSPKLVILSDPESLDAENFRHLRAQVLFSKGSKKPRVIMVTSCCPGEGKTFVAANLAASIALGIDEHVLLIDGDLRQPRLHEMLGYESSEGLNEYLIGKRTLPELIIRTEIRKLSFLPAGNRPANPTELLSSRTMGNFIREVRDRYDDRFIVIDSTPNQVTSEAKTLARYVDGVIHVVMARKSPRKAIEEAIEDIGREKILGFVFNGYESARKKYYDSYYSHDRARPLPSFNTGAAQSKKPDEAVPEKTPFTILAGEFSDVTEMAIRKNELMQAGYSSYAIRRKDGNIRLLVGAYLTRQGAERDAEGLRSRGIDAKVIDR